MGQIEKQLNFTIWKLKKMLQFGILKKLILPCEKLIFYNLKNY